LAGVEVVGTPGELATERDVIALQQLREDIRLRLEQYVREHGVPGVHVLEFLLAFVWGWYRKTKTIDLRAAPSAIPAITEELMNRAGMNWRQCEEAERRRSAGNPIIDPSLIRQTG
jgi:hypothetical protein